MLAIFSGVVGLLLFLWMFHDFIWKTPPSVERQLGKPDQPIEYNLDHTVSHVVNHVREEGYSLKNCMGGMWPTSQNPYPT